MNLTKDNSNQSVPSFFDTFFDDFFGSDFNKQGPGKYRFTQPLVNIADEKSSFLIEMAVPGLSREDIKIEIVKDQLLVEGNKEENKEGTDKNFSRKEFYFGKFKKSYHIPETVDKNSIDAAFSDGILKISLNKKEEAIDKGPLSIEIK